MELKCFRLDFLLQNSQNMQSKVKKKNLKNKTLKSCVCEYGFTPHGAPGITF